MPEVEVVEEAAAEDKKKPYSKRCKWALGLSIAGWFVGVIGYFSLYLIITEWRAINRHNRVQAQVQELDRGAKVEEPESIALLWPAVIIGIPTYPLAPVQTYFLILGIVHLF